MAGPAELEAPERLSLARPALVSLALLAVMLAPLWLTFPSSPVATFETGTQAEVEAAAERVSGYLFRPVLVGLHGGTYERELEQAFPDKRSWDEKRRAKFAKPEPKAEADKTPHEREQEAKARARMVARYQRLQTKLQQLSMSSAAALTFGWLWMLVTTALMRKWDRIKLGRREGKYRQRIAPPQLAIVPVALVILALPGLSVQEPLAAGFALPALVAYVSVWLAAPWAQ